MAEENLEYPEEKKKSPLIYFIAVFLILILILWIIPSYAIKFDENPRNIPKISEFNITIKNYERLNYSSIQDLYLAVSTNNPELRDLSSSVAVSSCKRGQNVCFAKAIYNFVRDNIEYVNDPVGKEYIEHPLQVLSTRAADCESGSVLLVSMLGSIGIEADFVFNPGHVFVKIPMPDAQKRYKRNGDNVYLDWTCGDCEFGELPQKDKI